ncbi:MAG TPA: hypothetical protein VMU28_13460 [Terriglobales bacterium]|nr:hypothetical protein [Terriglobales bacterium]
MAIGSDLLPMVTKNASWTADWAWGLPIIVLNVIIHVLGLGKIRYRTGLLAKYSFQQRHPTTGFALVLGMAALLATCLHGLEAAIWAVAYRLLHALPDARSAMLYSLNALTSYGHVTLELEYHWQFMGALEALNGWLLFGLTTAFLFAIMEKAWSTDTHDRRHSAASASG